MKNVIKFIISLLGFLHFTTGFEKWGINLDDKSMGMTPLPHAYICHNLNLNLDSGSVSALL